MYDLMMQEAVKYNALNHVEVARMHKAMYNVAILDNKT